MPADRRIRRRNKLEGKIGRVRPRSTAAQSQSELLCGGAEAGLEFLVTQTAIERRQFEQRQIRLHEREGRMGEAIEFANRAWSIVRTQAATVTGDETRLAYGDPSTMARISAP